MKIEADIPTAEDLTDGLTVEECHPPLEEAKQAADEAKAKLEAAKQDVTDQKAKIAGARATGADADELEELLTRQKALEMLAEDAEEELAVARASLERETVTAKRALSETVDARLAQLQAAADELAPHLLALRDLFGHLRSHVRRQDRAFDLVDGQAPRWPLSMIARRFLRVPAVEIDWIPPEKREEADAARRENARAMAGSRAGGRAARSSGSGSGEGEDAMIRQGMAGLEAAERSGRLR